MPTIIDKGKVKRPISRVVRLGASLYCLLPKELCAEVGFKLGDRLCMETDGRMVYATRVPFEELMARKTKPNGGNVTVQARPDDYVKGGK